MFLLYHSLRQFPTKRNAMTQPTAISQSQTSPLDEQILVVKRTHLFPDGPWHGLQDVDMQEYLHIVKMYQEFQPRSVMETDTSYKQIIPYLVFRHDGLYFLMERQAKPPNNG